MKTRIMSYQQIVKNADGSIKINMPFYDLYTSGKKITLDDLKKTAFAGTRWIYNGLTSFQLMFSRPEFDLEMLKWFVQHTDFYELFGYTSEESTHNPFTIFPEWIEGITILLHNPAITFEMVKYIMNLDPGEDEYIAISSKNIKEAQKENPAITDEMVEYVVNFKPAWYSDNEE